MSLLDEPFSIWTIFYAACEAQDRAGRHVPFTSRLDPYGVHPTVPRSYRKLMDARDKRLIEVNADSALSAQARKIALDLHRNFLDPCECERCANEQTL